MQDSKFSRFPVCLSLSPSNPVFLPIYGSFSQYVPFSECSSLSAYVSIWLGSGETIVRTMKLWVHHGSGDMEQHCWNKCLSCSLFARLRGLLLDLGAFFLFVDSCWTWWLESRLSCVCLCRTFSSLLSYSVIWCVLTWGLSTENVCLGSMMLSWSFSEACQTFLFTLKECCFDKFGST